MSEEEPKPVRRLPPQKPSLGRFVKRAGSVLRSVARRAAPIVGPAVPTPPAPKPDPPPAPAGTSSGSGRRPPS